MKESKKQATWAPQGRVLITGATGVIGSWVAAGLVNRGIRPVLLDQRADYSLLGSLKDNVDLVVGDILDWPTLTRVMLKEKVEVVIHLAVLMIPAAQANPYQAFQVNAQGSINVFEAARAAGSHRVVWVSSRSVFGQFDGEFGHPTYRPVDEYHPRQPRTVYGATKLAVEAMAEQYRRIYGQDIIGLRFPAIYGPGRLQRHGAISLTSRIIESGLAGRSLSLPDGGDQKDDQLYVKDAAEALVASAAAPGPTPEPVYNLGTGHPVGLRDFAAAVKAVAPGADITIGPGLDYVKMGYTEYAVLDGTRAARDLGFVPRFDLPGGVRDYAESLRALGLKPLG